MIAAVDGLTGQYDRAMFARIVAKQALEYFPSFDLVAFMDQAQIPEHLRWTKYLEKPNEFVGQA